MNFMSPKVTSLPHSLARKSEVYSTIDEVCAAFELTDTQFDAAKTSYEATGAWLMQSSDPVLQSLQVYPHGSMALGTTVKPLAREEHDVDVICHLPDFSRNRSPAELKKVIGDRLRQHDRYAAILEEKKRCWRLNYQLFHIDFSPTIRNLDCPNGGELVPDKQLRMFKPTNPKAYKKLFFRRAALMPRLKIQKAIAADSQRGMSQFPRKDAQKGILHRIVQLSKRHRDVMFAEVEANVAPISIILTTLASQAYEYCVGQFEFETELDVIYNTVLLMPHFVERKFVNGKSLYVVANETTEGENFAERWNTEPERFTAFTAWHAKAVEDFSGLASVEGIDVLAEKLDKSLGSREVRKVFGARTQAISNARSSSKLFAAPAVGLTLSQSARATPVPRNTHFGD